MLVLGASGQALASSSKPVEVAALVQADEPHGTGTLRYWGFDVYDAALWMDAEHWSLNTPFALSLKYVMSLSQERMVEESIKQLQTQKPWPDATLKRFKTLLTQALPAVSKHDRLTAIYKPKGPLKLYLNGKYLSQISDKELLPAFVNIWLGEGNDLPELRADLLNLEQ